MKIKNKKLKKKIIIIPILLNLHFSIIFIELSHLDLLFIENFFSSIQFFYSFNNLIKIQQSNIV